MRVYELLDIVLITRDSDAPSSLSKKKQEEEETENLGPS
jgi:hypothetical protein